MRNPVHTTPCRVVLALSCTVIAGCSFPGAPGRLGPEDLNARWSKTSMTTPYASNRYAVHTDRRFETHYGASCASANRAVSRDNAGAYVYGIGVEDSIAFPPGFDAGTVFLNGWRLRYGDGDHQVFALSSALVDIEKSDGELRWKAGAVLADKNGDDAFAWCYHYTVLLWRRGVLDTRADVRDSDENAELTFLSHDPGNPLSSYRSVPNRASERIPGRSAAVLPRGFGVMWERFESDHPLLQFSMKYGDVGIVTYEDGSGSDVIWNTETVFRDKNTDDDYVAAEIVSILDGADVGLIQPGLEIYDIPPLGQSSGTREIFADTVVVENVPFDYAVPMLTGWDMGDNEKEINIKDIGAWIESFSYERAPGAVSGTLIYTIKSVFLDKGERFSSVGARAPRYQVSVLGLDASDVIVTVPGGGPGTWPPVEGPGSGLPLGPPRVTTGTGTNGTLGSGATPGGDTTARPSLNPFAPGG